MLIDQTLDTEVQRLDPEKVKAMIAAYKLARGDEPNADIEPTSDQLAALAQLLASDTVPYADFAIWGPHGRRLLAKLMYVAFVHAPDGSWQRRELPGPPDFDHWWASWRVLRTAFLLLGADIRALNARYGQAAWFLVYTADVRMRSEQLERVRRTCEQDSSRAEALGLPPTFSKTRPWNDVFRACLLDKSWWDENVRDAALLYLARVRSAEAAADDGTTQPNLSSPAVSAPKSAPKPQRQAPREESDSPAKRRDRDLSVLVDGLYVKNRRGLELCVGFNQGTCHGRSCAKGAAHQCSKCLQEHPLVACSGKLAAATPAKGKGKRKGTRK
jgi:hypothetical protein